MAYHRQRALHFEKYCNYQSACGEWRINIEIQSKKPNIESLTGLARCLQKSGDYEEAEKVYSQINSQYPAYKNGYALRAVNLDNAGMHHESLQYWDRCIDLDNNPPRIKWLLMRAKNHLLLNNFHDAEDQYLYIYELYPSNCNAVEALCRLYNIKQDWKSLHKYSKILIEKDLGRKHKSHWDFLYVKSLIGLHQVEMANKYFFSIIDSYEHKPIIIGAIVKIAIMLKLVDRLEYNWEELLNKYPDNHSLYMTYAKYLSHLGDYGLLKTYVDVFKKKTSFHMPLYTCCLPLFLYKEAREYLDKSPLLDHNPLRYTIAMARIFMHSWDNSELQKTLPNLLTQEINHPHSIELKIFLINVYIRLNEIDEAISRIEKIDPWLTGRQDVCEFLVWRENTIGHHDYSKDISINLLKTHYFHSMHAPISITRIDKRKMIHRDDEILLFSAMKNCIDNLPWFLDYYRNLGVNYFFILDNDSDDGTSEYLLNQSDVYLFYSNDSYAHNKSGMRWINHLMAEYAGNAWSIFVDIDEALVFPDVEGSSLRNVLDYMDKQGHEILSAFMLDMYPADIQTLRTCCDASERIKKSIYFDNDYQFFNTTTCPYKAVKGGVRDRLYGTRELLEKVPIVRGGRGISYLISHGVTSAVCSDITAVLLHYNIPLNPQLLNSEWAIHNDSKIRSRVSGCRKRYALYSDVNNNLDPKHSYLNKNSVKYESPQQLIELGLLYMPDTYEY